MITENLEQVRKNIEEACRAVNRDPGEVTLISVSKTKPVSMLQEAYDAGSRDSKNSVQTVKCQLNPMVCHTSLREIVSADFFGAISCSDLASSGFRLRIMLFGQFHLIQTGTKHFQCLIFILEL